MNQAITEQCEKVLESNGLNPVRRLGKGAFGIVYLVSKGSDMTQLYSVKCTYKKQFCKKPVLRKYLKQEIDLMQTLDHQGIVKLHRSFQDDGWIFMLMEYCDQGNLTMVQTLKKDLIFPFQEFCPIFLEILDALEYLHSKNIIHRDIKPQNILRTTMRSSNQVVTKICDFGFSREIQEDVSTVCGTTYFMAPQIFAKRKYDKTVDIWAVGVLAFSMLFAVVPFKSINMELEILNKCQGGFDLFKKKTKNNPTIGKQQMKTLAEIFAGIFQINPEKRFSIDKIRNLILPFCTPVLRKESSGKALKKSIETDISEEEEPIRKSFELEEVDFIQNVWRQIKKQAFLTPLELSVLKYQLEKVCISILSCGRTPNEITPKEVKKIEELKDNQASQILTFKGRLKEIQISKLPEVFKSRQTLTFQQYKEEYRLVVGHAFSKAQKNIKNYDLKMRIKLKLLCCHTINRVFEKEHSLDLFRHFLQWQKAQGKEQKMAMKPLQQWIDSEDCGKIIETIDLINTRFYGKPG